MARLSSGGSHGQDGHATAGEEGVILIFPSAVSAFSAVSDLPPRRRRYLFGQIALDIAQEFGIMRDG